MNRRAIILILVGVVALAGRASAGTYSGGTGEPNNPYRIATPNDLNDIGNHVEDLNKSFVMVNDINLADYTGTEFNIIGDDWDQPFEGVFDGNGHTISNLTSDGRDFGLFCYVDDPNAEIKNLTLIDPNINLGYIGNGSVLVKFLRDGTISTCVVEGGRVLGGFDSGSMGGLAGSMMNGTISNCHTTILISGGEGSIQVGGLVGNMQNGTISNCYAVGDIHGHLIIGGLVGTNLGTILDCYATGGVSGRAGFGNDIGGLVGSNHGTISTCYAYGSVSGEQSVGGLVGDNSFGTISNCYAAGEVSGDSIIGGLVGHNQDAAISNCYATCSVDGNDNTGGLVGYHSSGFYSKCFWDADVNPDVNGIGNTTDPNVIGKSTVEMQKESTFTDAGWDFVEVWNIGENQTYPFLRVYPAGDVNHDGRVDLFDFGILAGHWLEGVE